MEDIYYIVTNKFLTYIIDSSTFCMLGLLTLIFTCIISYYTPISLKFIFIYFSNLLILYFSNSILNNIVLHFYDGLIGDIITFLILHFIFVIIIVPTKYFKDFKFSLWLLLTLLHGLAHIVHPAFRGVIVNNDYTPFYDYMVHGAQCLMVYYYHKDLFILGIYLCISMFCGSTIAHLNKEFMENFIWILISAAGVFGTHYHMMLINNKRDKNIFNTSLVIWISPYIGYLNMEWIPYWDSFLNNVGLFRYWFLAFGLSNIIYNSITCDNLKQQSITKNS